MGNRWEVWAYVLRGGLYGYEQVWRGQSVVRCVLAAVKAKRAGAGCVKVEWRG